MNPRLLSLTQPFLSLRTSLLRMEDSYKAPANKRVQGNESSNLTTLTPGHDTVQKVTLIPRGQARGLTWFIPSDDPTLISKQQLFARIVGGLGGRAAEEVIFGESEVTTGAVGDLQ